MMKIFVGNFNLMARTEHRKD